MLSLRTTRARMILLFSVLALLALLTTVLVLTHSHLAVNASVLPDGVFGGH